MNRLSDSGDYMYAFGITDVGKVRSQNEDSIFYTQDQYGSLPNLFIVSDGMGGHRAGEVASSKAVEYFCSYAQSRHCTPDEILDFLISAVAYANEQVYEISLSDPVLYGMGATFSVCVVLGMRVFLAHIGDSRVYFASANGLVQLTTDHSYVNELVRAGQITEADARVHPRKNMLTRALGVSYREVIDGLVYDIEDDGMILLCSDGLTNMLTDSEIHSIILMPVGLEQKARHLISAANENGGQDNISVILADVRR
jgi:protein phosphatase